MTHAHRSPSRRRGVALLLVLFSVAIATVLSMSFLSAQSTTGGIRDNVRHHGRARFIAESALQIIARHIMASTNWRMQFGDGVWLSDEPLAGGTFTIEGRDGAFTGDGGLAGGDGDLLDDPLDPVTLIVTGEHAGRTHTVRAVITAYPGASGNAYGVAAAGRIILNSNARIDAFNSATGVYNPAINSNTAAAIASNATGGGHVQVTGGAAVIGDVYIGTGGQVATVIDGQEQITGVKAALTAPLAIPAVPALTPMPSSSGSFNSSWLSFLTSGVYRYSSFVLSDNDLLTVTGDVTIYCDGTFTIDDHAHLWLLSTAKLTVYAHSFIFTTGGKLNMTAPANPGRVILYATSNADLVIDGGFEMAASILAPQSMLRINNSRFFGNYVGKDLELTNGARFTQDRALIEGGGTSINTSANRPTYNVQWLEQP